MEVSSMKLEIVEQEKEQSIQRWVYQVLRTNIIKMKLRPSQQISENEISDALHVSRTPVREAFIRLAEDGLLKITPQKRTVVSLISLQQAEEARFIRRAIEKAVIKEACGTLEETVKAELRGNIDEQVMCRKAAAHDRMLVLDDDFHRTIFRCCGKELSWLYIQKLDYNYDRLRALALPRIIDDVVSEHQKILDAITAGRVESIDALVEEHMNTKAIDRAVQDCPREYFEAFPAPTPARPEVEEKGGSVPVPETRFQHTH
jgi:GntR family transcriptional regulator, rspAB operon transcriptional repressor